MKRLHAFVPSFALGLLVFGSAASACPDLSGKFAEKQGSVWASRKFVEIAQTGCEQLQVIETVREVGNPDTVVTSTVVVSHERQLDPNSNIKIYWLNAWEQSALTREPWNAPTGGQLIGYKSRWFIGTEDQKPALHMQVLNDQGEVDSEDVLLKE